jgi:hypothetical protein
MDERDRQKVEVVDTADQPAEGGKVVEETVAENQARKNPQAGKLVPLFDRDATEKFRTRWLSIQSKFVDDPGDSVKQADQLVDDLLQNIMRNFADRRGSLEKQWNGGANASTEDLRIALQQYRSFFDRLLTLES